MGADQDDRWQAELSGGGKGGGNFRQVLIMAPCSPLLKIGAGALVAQYGPAAGALAPAAAGPLHQKHPRPGRSRGREHQCFGLRLNIKAVEAVGRPPAPVLDEDPNQAARGCTCNRVAAKLGAFCAEETFRSGHGGEVTGQREREPQRATAFRRVRRRDQSRCEHCRRAGTLQKANLSRGSRANPRA